eukprot:GHVS01018804.1.p1 GENE.GHVS01018804.1~~GHVS01018804.1.p1  ORF type:complete len:674 (+),score=175.47 GHVS01018804.1:515-2536(+)
MSTTAQLPTSCRPADDISAIVSVSSICPTLPFSLSTAPIAYYTTHMSATHQPPPHMSAAVLHRVISSAPQQTGHSYLLQQTGPSQFSSSADASPRTKKRLTYSRYYQRAEAAPHHSCHQQPRLSSNTTQHAAGRSSREMGGSICEAAAGCVSSSGGMLVGMQLSLSHGRIQPTASTPPLHTTPSSSNSSTATPTTSSPSTTDSSTTPAMQPLTTTTTTSGFSTQLTNGVVVRTRNNNWADQDMRCAVQEQFGNKYATVQQQYNNNSRPPQHPPKMLSVSSHPTLREVNPQPPLVPCSADCRYIPSLASTSSIQPKTYSAEQRRSPPHGTTLVNGIVGGGGWQTRTATTRGDDGRSSCTYSNGSSSGCCDPKQQGTFMCECLARHRGGGTDGGEARVRASVIGRCQTATTARVMSGCKTSTAQTTSSVVSTAQSLCGGGGRVVCANGGVAGGGFEATTTTNGSSGGTMSRVCTETSEEELSGCCVSSTGSVISCITTTGSSGGIYTATSTAATTTSVIASGIADNNTVEAMAFLKYKIGHMSPTLVLVCFNFAEMCWDRFRNMDILGAVELMPAPTGLSSMSENTNVNSKPSTRLALSKAAALLIAFLARYRLHEDDIVAVLCTAYSYLQAMDTPTLQPLVRQMVLWFYPSNILYFLAFLAHIHVLDDTSRLHT